MQSENGGILELLFGLVCLAAAIAALWQEPIFRAALIWLAPALLLGAALGIFLGLLFIVVK
ncbi:MAG: hypothetical protein DRJ52_10740, partial [Thermoprotei archaeon]